MSQIFESFISFHIGHEFFAFDTLKVRHILEKGKITPVPLSKPYLLGVINLHGNILPVADLRMMLGSNRIEDSADTSIVVVSVDGNNDTYIGFVVDAVDEVLDASQVEMKEMTALDMSNQLAHCFSGTFHYRDRFVHYIGLDELTKFVEE